MCLLQYIQFIVNIYYLNADKDLAWLIFFMTALKCKKLTFPGDVLMSNYDKEVFRNM